MLFNLLFICFLYVQRCLSDVPIHNRDDVLHALILMHKKYNIKVIIVKGILVDQDGKRIERSFFDVKDQIPVDPKYKQPTTLIAEHGADQDKVKMILIGSVLDDSRLPAPPPSQSRPRVFEISFDYFDFVFGGTGDVFAAAFLSSLLRPSAKDSQQLSFDQVKSACEVSVCVLLYCFPTSFFVFYISVHISIFHLLLVFIFYISFPVRLQLCIEYWNEQ